MSRVGQNALVSAANETGFTKEDEVVVVAEALAGQLPNDHWHSHANSAERSRKEREAAKKNTKAAVVLVVVQNCADQKDAHEGGEEGAAVGTGSGGLAGGEKARLLPNMRQVLSADPSKAPLGQAHMCMG